MTIPPGKKATHVFTPQKLTKLGPSLFNLQVKVKIMTNIWPQKRWFQPAPKIVLTCRGYFIYLSVIAPNSSSPVDTSVDMLKSKTLIIQ